jgi:hypothetical protein
MTLSLLLTILLFQGVAPAQGGAVAGTLRGNVGQPAARVRVGIMSMPEAGRGLRGAGTLVSQVETDDAGRFRLEQVPPGRYYIVAGRLDVPTFYPGVREIGSAKTIEVRANATVRDIDFEVLVYTYVFATPPGTTPPLPPVSVTGRIVLKNNPTAPMPPYITLQGSPGTSSTLTVARDGMFNVTLPAGNQLLYVSLPAGYSVVSLTSGGKNLLAEAIDVKTGVDLVVSLDVGDIRPRYRLIALVREDSTDRFLAGERVELVNSSGEVLSVTVNAQGAVTFPRLLQGTYLLRLASAGFDVPEKQVVITDSSVQVELRARQKP